MRLLFGALAVLLIASCCGDPKAHGLAKPYTSFSSAVVMSVTHRPMSSWDSEVTVIVAGGQVFKVSGLAPVYVDQTIKLKKEVDWGGHSTEWWCSWDNGKTWRR